VKSKILLLQQWHALSDPGAEEAVRDRLSFRRVSWAAVGDGDAGPRLDLAVSPDNREAWPFGRAAGRGQRQLDALGLVVKRGTLVDATPIAGAVRRPYEGGGVNPRDPDAHFLRKRDKTYFGYKAHLAVDEESGLMRQAEMTSANVHDSRLGEALIQGDEQGYFADKAYDSLALREALERRGLVDGIAWKVKHPRYPLEAW
jgi:transposase, IS5 family